MSELLLLIAQADNWSGSFFGLNEELRSVILLVGIGCSTGLLIVLGSLLGGMWCSVKQKQIEAELKRDMLDRGMSAEEIEQVIEATPKEGLGRWISLWKKDK